MIACSVTAVDFRISLRDKLDFVGPKEAVRARVAVAECADPCQVQVAGAGAEKVVCYPCVEFAGIVDFGLQEQGLLRECVPAAEDMVEVGFAFAAHVRQGYDLACAELGLDLRRGGTAVFEVDCYLGVGEGGDAFEIAEESGDAVEGFLVHAYYYFHGDLGDVVSIEGDGHAWLWSFCEVQNAICYP